MNLFMSNYSKLQIFIAMLLPTNPHCFKIQNFYKLPKTQFYNPKIMEKQNK